MKALVYSTLAAATFASCAAVDTDHAMSFCESQINEAVLRAHVEFLSSDELGGRGVGTEGDVLARNYIAAQLRAAGCEPGAADGSWLQPVPILGIKSNVTKSLKARGAKGTAAFEAPTDYTAVAGSPDATAAWDEA
ncbi:MAG: hypothetical protein ACI9SE_000285, partial [Neolewinella sp.]